MRIGVDFDNTLVDYFGVFQQVALELDWIPEWVGQSKTDVKHHLKDLGQHDRWTELQGIVYGREIRRARLYNGALQVLHELKGKGHDLILISHKTKYPVIGEKFDFHMAAENFLKEKQALGVFSELHFCTEKLQKVQAIAARNLHVFVDDLPDILMHAEFPSGTRGILFSNCVPDNFPFPHAGNWQTVLRTIENEPV